MGFQTTLTIGAAAMRYESLQDWAVGVILRFYNWAIWGLMWNRAYARIAALEKLIGKKIRLDLELPGDREGGLNVCWSAKLLICDEDRRLGIPEVLAYSYFPGFTALSGNTEPGFTLPRRTMETYDLLFDGWFRDMQQALSNGKYKVVENIVIADCIFRAIEAAELGIADMVAQAKTDKGLSGFLSDAMFGIGKGESR